MAKYCKHCGNEMRDSSEFCPLCGRAATSPSPVAPTFNREMNPPMSAPPPTYGAYAPAPDSNDQIASVGRWFWFLLLYAVPVVGFIFLIITACGGFGNKSMTNFARANLIYLLIAVVIAIFIVFLSTEIMSVSYY